MVHDTDLTDLSRMRAAAPTSSELQQTLPLNSQNDPSSNSTEGSKKRAISEITKRSEAPATGCIVDTNGPAKKKKLRRDEAEGERKAEQAKGNEKEANEKERALKEGQKAVKKVERDEKKKKKDEERKKKDDEKKKRDEEKAKKDRAQTRLQNFFVKPASAPKGSANVAAAFPVSGLIATLLEPKVMQERSDYERNFQPFFVKPNVKIAPPHSFQRDNSYKCTIKASIDRAMSLQASISPDQMQVVPATGRATSKQIVELLHIPPYKQGPRGKLLGYTTKTLLTKINTLDDFSLPPIIDQKSYRAYKGLGCTAICFRMLNCLPNKFLRFAEDVRPPYSGTFTRKPTTIGLLKGRNPFQKTLPRINYDYDSEAEWEEGAQDGEVEDLLSDDGEEDEEVESLGDEMDGFLDDEEDETARGQRGALAALVPQSSGLCWEDEGGRNTRTEFKEMGMEVLLDGISCPIDPFSAAYWNTPPKNAKTWADLAPATSMQKPSTTMEPPRFPFYTPNRPQVTNITIGVEAVTVKKGKNVPLVSAEDLDAFKSAVEGSDMTKAGLIEVLKKQFPRIGKESIKQTLTKVAVRVGDRERDKRWILI